MAGENITVFGIYPHRAGFEYAVDALKKAGFRATDVSVLFHGSPEVQDPVTEKATNTSDWADAGAGSGAVTGGALDWMAGTGALALPIVGPLFIAGPIVAAFAGIGGDNTRDEVAVVLVRFGLPECEARRYQRQIENGSILLSVHCDNSYWMKNATSLLSATGAEDPSSTGECAPCSENADPLKQRRAFG